MRKYICLLFTLVMLLCISAAPAFASSEQIDNGDQVDDTAAINTAISNATDGTATTPSTVILNDEGSCFTVSRANSANARAIDITGINHFELKGLNGDQACIKRSGVPDGDTVDSVNLIHIRGAATDDIRLTDLELQGNDQNHNGSVTFPNSLDTDTAIAVDGAGTSTSDRVQGLTFDNILMTDIFGACYASKYVYDINWTDVGCDDPVKDGYTFSKGSWGGETLAATDRGTLVDVWATDTDDDALAFNSCWGDVATACAVAGGFDITGTYTDNNISTSKFKVNHNTASAGAAFFCRGCWEVTSWGVVYRGTEVAGGYNGRGAAMFEDSFSSSGKYSNAKNVMLNDGEIDGMGVSDAVEFETDGSGLQILSNELIQHPSGFCGIHILAGSTATGIAWGGQNNFDPTNSSNVCDDR